MIVDHENHKSDVLAKMIKLLDYRYLRAAEFW